MAAINLLKVKRAENIVPIGSCDFHFAPDGSMIRAAGSTLLESLHHLQAILERSQAIGPSPCMSAAQVHRSTLDLKGKR